MRRSNDVHPAKHENGSDYYSHIQKVARTPSVLTEVPHGQSIFHKDVQLEKEERGGQHQQHHQQKQQHTPEVHKRVEVTERVTEFDKNGNRTVSEQPVDVEAEHYIEQKHRGFGLCKWKTFGAR